MSLRNCFDRYQCDKGHRHAYERVYEPVFEPIRNEALRILEIGILRGASMLAWADYFPNAEIVGVDLFKRVPLEKVPTHERVTLVQGDSTEINLDGHFDVIIDDGAHDFVTQRKTFENLHSHGDRYFIEDVWPLDRMSDAELAHPWLRTKGFALEDYCLLLDVLKPHDVTWHDVRKGYQPDSCIVEVRQ